MKNSRTINTAKNILWGYVGNIATLILQFISRTIFIYTIGMTYLGVSGLFTNILGMLSLTELGIGTAINYSLYKPVAEDDKEKIKSLMFLYKKAYSIIAIIIAIIGLILLPFLKYLIKDANGLEISEISVYYLIYLFNTVSTYFVSYKYGLLYAEQNGYIITNLNTIFSIIILFGQMITMYVFKNFFIYLIIQSILQLIQKLITNVYLNRHYSYLLGRDIKPLKHNELKKIKQNVVALMIHKIGEVSVYQTDNIIISIFISVTTVAKVSNYNLIITSITGFITIIMNSVTNGLGNLIALENEKKQLKIFDTFNFVTFWLYGFTSICFFVLFKPFMILWIGENALIDDLTVFLIIVSYYLTGQRTAVNNMKTAGGIFVEDKYVSLLQGFINLVLSVIFVSLIGLPGIYVGTVLSGLFVNIVRPQILYKSMFKKSATRYYIKFIEYIIITIFCGILVRVVVSSIFGKLTWLTFFTMSILCVLLTNIFYTAIYFKSSEFKELTQRITTLLKFIKNEN